MSLNDGYREGKEHPVSIAKLYKPKWVQKLP